MGADGQLRTWLDGLAALGGAVSAAEAIVADGERILFRHASGYRVGGERLVAASGARFDAASLTKPWMATLALVLAGGTTERLPLDEPIEPRPDAPSLQALLRHRAGMPAWAPLAARLGNRLGDASALKSFLLGESKGSSGAPVDAVAVPVQTPASRSQAQRANGRPRDTAGHAPAPPQPFNESLSSLPFSSNRPPPSALYSDLGYLLWGLLAEARLGRPLATFLDAEVCAPLGVAGLGRLALAAEVPGAVECRLGNGKEVELAAAQGIALGFQRAFRRGAAQDGNARALMAVGRLGAHAGLFVTADEMLALGREWLRPSRLLAPDQVASALAGDGDYALGWARWSESGSSGPALSRSSFGHTGFTGGSLWIDPEQQRIYLLLAHRLSSRADFNPARREFHRLAAAL